MEDHVPTGYARHAVCLMLFDSTRTELLLIQKADTDGYPWRNHVALPGGRIEPGDPDAQAAALRELQEELGVAPSDVDVLGHLGHFQTLISTHDLDVIVGRWVRRSALNLDDREVARVLKCPLNDLVGLHCGCGFCARPADEIGDGLVYPLPEARIWGVTARILHRFLEIASSEDVWRR